MSEILRLSNVKLNYGPITAIKGIDLSVEEGQIVAILGANGAGKTSTLKVIAGLLKPSAGEITFEGKKISGKPAHKIAQMGIMQSPEGRHVLIGLTVEENLRVGGYNIKSKEELQKNFERVYTLFPRLKERAKQQSSTLSGGEQQMLAIGRALMGSPKLLVLDEPSLGLAPLLIKDIFNTLVKIKEEGTTILIVEQNALSTLKIADYAYVLELGKISMHGKSEELLKDERLIAAYLGGK
ncbi:MAG: ABC transporter ATP-binding protein [Clostridia bacterium]|nr:ABC transporter ATP-binding protein [Clostridia bacterium]